MASHQKFIAKFNLPYLLLADTGKEVAQKYGVWVEKTLYGKKHMGIERSTFVIGPDGILKKVFRKVQVDGHVDEVLGAVAAA